MPCSSASPFTQLTRGFKQTAAWAAFGGSSRVFPVNPFSTFLFGFARGRVVFTQQVSSIARSSSQDRRFSKGAKLRFDIEKSGGSELAKHL